MLCFNIKSIVIILTHCHLNLNIDLSIYTCLLQSVSRSRSLDVVTTYRGVTSLNSYIKVDFVFRFVVGAASSPLLVHLFVVTHYYCSSCLVSSFALIHIIHIEGNSYSGQLYRLHGVLSVDQLYFLKDQICYSVKYASYISYFR